MQTIIAAFDQPSTAQQAVDSLIAKGFSRSAVHLQSGYAGGTTGGSTMSSTDSTEHTGFIASVENFFSNLFSDEDESTRSRTSGQYVEAVRKGNSVVAVDVASDDEAEQASTLLYDLGATDVEEQGSTTGSMQSASSTAGYAGTEAAEGGVLKVVQEDLVVGKRTVQGGGVRVVSRVTSTPVSELVRLREEHAVVERRPVDRPATEADFQGFKEGTIEVRESAEEAVVGKTARVVEEVVVGKQVTEREETVSDTVRRTDVDVERVEGTNTVSDRTDTYGKGTR